ncbi:MAG: aspartate aminotransferase family protein [Saprospiraceae bacterium]|nr:aspartate aminotransferase family protein [Saprospiraceae bacterium]
MMYLRRQFLEHIAQTSEIPQGFEIQRAEACYLYDRQGNPYLDLISGFGVNNIGHSIEDVKNAIRDQSEKYLHTNVYGEHIQSPQVQFAGYLTSLLPTSLNSCYFLSSGSECIDAAIKLVRLVTNRSEIIVCRNAYHGSTLGAESLRSDEAHKAEFRPLIPGIRFIDFGNISDLDLISNKTAAVFTEVVQAEAGVRQASVDYWQELKAKCIEKSSLLVFDEIQTGIGRTGKLFAFQNTNIIPDILLSGKAIGSGMPLAALICDHKIMEAFSKRLALGYITTFGGHPVSCAAGLAGLKYLLNHNILEGVESKEKLFKGNLLHEDILEIRSSGLMIAVQLGSESMLISWLQKLYKNKILAESFLFCSSALRIAPPLIISDEQILDVCEIINNIPRKAVKNLD